MTVIKQYYFGDLTHASYLLANEAGGQAAVVEPQCDVASYVKRATRQRYIDRQCLSGPPACRPPRGSPQLRDRVGASIRLGA